MPRKEMVEGHIVDRWLDRGNRFFRATTRSPVIRGLLFARGPTDEELRTGWEPSRCCSAACSRRQPSSIGSKPWSVSSSAARSPSR